MRKDNMSVAVIARLFRVREEEVRKQMRKWMGLETTPAERFLEEKDKVVAAYEGGMTRITIAQKWGVNVSTVHKHLARWGYPQKPLTPLLLDEENIVRMKEAGLTYVEIAKEMGVSPTTIGRFFRRAISRPEIPPPPRVPSAIKEAAPGDMLKLNGREYRYIENIPGPVPKWLFAYPKGTGRESFTIWQLLDAAPVMVRRMGEGDRCSMQV